MCPLFNANVQIMNHREWIGGRWHRSHCHCHLRVGWCGCRPHCHAQEQELGMEKSDSSPGRHPALYQQHQWLQLHGVLWQHVLQLQLWNCPAIVISSHQMLKYYYFQSANPKITFHEKYIHIWDMIFIIFLFSAERTPDSDKHINCLKSVNRIKILLDTKLKTILKCSPSEQY